MILIDSSAFIEFLNRTDSTADRLVAHLIREDEDLVIPALAVTEILQGIKNDREYREVKRSLLTFPILSLKGTGSYAAAAELYRQCRKSGYTVRSTIDLLIAQIALEHGAELLHNDRDFDVISRVCNLKIYSLSHE
ncbi:MAG: PIN domain nuclease [Geobacteraceae bacterium]|nr:PIN domain nuclease [Geobacteraceae bacterium]